MADDRTTWNSDLLRLGGGFSQSWEWGIFQEKCGRKVKYLRIDGAPSLWIKTPLPFGWHYWYCPGGPVTAGAVGAAGPVAATEAARVGREGSPVGEASVAAAGADAFPGAVFIRFEPGFTPADVVKVIDRQPAQTWILDLAPDEQDLLKAMHPKTRYNLNLAERKGVRTYRASLRDQSALDVFWALVGETTSRDRFRAHDRKYYERMLETLAGHPATDAKNRPVATLEFAEHDGRVLAANLMVWFGDTVTYLHGASSSARREVMAPHLLHWNLIREAKRLGFKHYDFWGVAPEGAVNHPWAGVTRFKRGFGGRYVSRPGTFELPLDRFRYFVNCVGQRLRGRA